MGTSWADSTGSLALFFRMDWYPAQSDIITSHMARIVKTISATKSILYIKAYINMVYRAVQVVE